jgi:hypothetical protein
MLIKRIDHKKFDIFFDEFDSSGKLIPSGWKNWSRFEITSFKGVKRLAKIGGISVPAQIFSFLNKRFGVKHV